MIGLRKPSLVVLLLLLGLTSCVSLKPEDRIATYSGEILIDPPENLSVGYHQLGMEDGYVVSLGYFTPAQVDDARWEFRRIRAAQGGHRDCSGLVQLFHREVQWFEVDLSSGPRCARVIYTARCMPDIGPDTPFPYPDPPSLEAFEMGREDVRSQPFPQSPLGPDCGEKDGEIILGQRGS